MINRRNFNKSLLAGTALALTPSLTIAQKELSTAEVTNVSITSYFNLEQTFGPFKPYKDVYIDPIEIEVRVDYTLDDKNHTIELEGFDKSWLITTTERAKNYIIFRDKKGNLIDVHKLTRYQYYEIITAGCHENYLIKLNDFQLKE